MEILKKIKVKLIIAIVLVILANFIIPNIAFAEENNHFKVNGNGGSIAQPIFDFVTFVGDSALSILQKGVAHGPDLFLIATSEETKSFNLTGAAGAIIGIRSINCRCCNGSNWYRSCSRCGEYCGRN